MKTYLILMALILLTVHSYANANLAPSEECHSKTGYCLAIGGVTTTDGSIVALEFATPGQELVNVPNGTDVLVANSSGIVTVIQAGRQIEVGVLDQSLTSQTGIIGFHLSPGVRMQSQITRKGTQISCSSSSLGVSEKYKTPVVEVTTVVSDGAPQIRFATIEEVGEGSSHVSMCDPNSGPTYDWN